jgi:UDPglucose 6-dehydrogenase
MKICVFGLWHLGSVTSACLSEIGFSVTGLDFNKKTIQDLKKGKAPIYEPGLDELTSKGIKEGRLSFTDKPNKALNNSDVLWVTFDTPVDDNDIADIKFVESNILSVMDFIQKDTKIIISSQVPVGFTSLMETIYKQKYPEGNVVFACSPENLRLGKAIQIFQNPDRIVIGIRENKDKQSLLPLFEKICPRLEWMSIESAEMTKHAINAFLATSVTFTNELASICEITGANAKEVERGLKTEERIGKKAYVGPGTAFAGGTLARDINFLIDLGKTHNQKTFLFKAVKESNDYHKDWIKRKSIEYLKELKGKTVAVLGLTYKAGTDTLRRSLSIELCHWLYEEGANIKAFDPKITHLPDELKEIISLQNCIKDTLSNVDCIIIATEWPLFRELDRETIESMSKSIVIDANGFLEKLFQCYKGMNYIAVGRKLE